MDSENSKTIKDISPLAEADSIAIKLNLDSDSDSDDIVKPLYKSDARSPVHLSDISTSSADTIPTARENKKYFPPIAPDAGGDIPPSKLRKSNDSEMKEDLPPVDRIEDLSDIDSNNDESELSSTAELLAAKVGILHIHSTEDLLNKSIPSDQFDSLEPGESGDVSNNCQSSSGFRESTDDSEILTQNSGDYIPPINNHFVVSSSTESDASCDEAMPQIPALSPLSANSWENPGTDSNLTDLMPECDSSLAEKYGFYSASSASDSMKNSSSSLSYSKSRSPRKHRRGRGEMKPKQDSKKKESKLDNSLYTEGSFAGACVHRDGSHLGNDFKTSITFFRLIVII